MYQRSGGNSIDNQTTAGGGYAMQSSWEIHIINKVVHLKLNGWRVFMEIPDKISYRKGGDTCFSPSMVSELQRKPLIICYQRAGDISNQIAGWLNSSCYMY